MGEVLATLVTIVMWFKPPAITTPTLPLTPISTTSEWTYPGSKSDSVETITAWYKAKIQDKDMTATSFVQTNTNGNILNKLAGANPNEKVQIEITKRDTDTEAEIKIILDN